VEGKPEVLCSVRDLLDVTQTGHGAIVSPIAIFGINSADHSGPLLDARPLSLCLQSKPDGTRRRTIYRSNGLAPLPTLLREWSRNTIIGLAGYACFA